MLLGRKDFKLTEVEDEDNKGDAAPKDKKSRIDEILKLPEVKEKRMGGAWMQGLPHCVSDEWFWAILKEKEDKKKEEEKLKCKQEQEAKAKAKRLKKQKKEAWKGLKRKHVVCKWVQAQDGSSLEGDSEEVILDDSSEADSAKEMKVTFTMKVHWTNVPNVGRSLLEQRDEMQLDVTLSTVVTGITQDLLISITRGRQQNRLNRHHGSASTAK